jgi:hypothetical protein
MLDEILTFQYPIIIFSKMMMMCSLSLSKQLAISKQKWPNFGWTWTSRWGRLNFFGGRDSLEKHGRHYIRAKATISAYTYVYNIDGHVYYSFSSYIYLHGICGAQSRPIYIYIFPPPSLSRYNNAETFDNYITARLEEEEKKVAAAAACSIYPPVF